MKSFEGKGDCISLPSWDFPIVVTGVEVLQAPECGWLIGVIGCFEVIRLFDDARLDAYPMYLYVPARQSVWFKVEPLGRKAQPAVVRLRIQYRPAEEGEFKAFYERRAPGER